MDPSGRPHAPRWMRWIVLCAISLVCFGQYFVYDSITPLGTAMKEQLSFSNAQYGLLFSYYSIPNVLFFMVIIAGVLVDRIGLKASGIIYASLCVAGAAITALGASPALPSVLGPAYGWLEHAFAPDYSASLKTMLAGRVIYGLGAEAILLVNNKVLARWFNGRELALAFGLNLAVMRLGTFAALNLESIVASWTSLSGALWFATGIMFAGLALFFVYLALERFASKRFDLTSVSIAPAEKFVLQDIFRFDTSFWLITLLCVTFYSAVFPFQAYAPDILVQKFGVDPQRAGSYASMLIVGTMIFTPIFGWLVDHRGRRATLMTWGSLLLIPCHLLLGFTNFPPVILMFVVGITLSLVPAALWSAIPMMVKESRLGTAFGFVGYVQNVGLMLFPWIAGKLADAHSSRIVVDGKATIQIDYTQTLVMFASLGIAGFVFSLLLRRADARRTDGFSIERVVLE